MSHRLEIRDGVPGDKKVLLDGQDISHAIRGFTYRTDYNSLPGIELELIIFDAATHATEVQVIIPDAARELLESLGWRPPE
jgi:hypothetical protein